LDTVYVHVAIDTTQTRVLCVWYFCDCLYCVTIPNGKQKPILMHIHCMIYKQ